jgi:hypothetical protein
LADANVKLEQVLFVVVELVLVREQHKKKLSEMWLGG